MKKLLSLTLLMMFILLAACGRGGDADYYPDAIYSDDADTPSESPEAPPIISQEPAPTPERTYAFPRPTWADQPTPPIHEPDPAMWRLIWSDEFDGDALDLSVWDIQTGTGVAFGLTGWGNYEHQYYHADNISVAHGYLRIEARHETRSSPAEGSRNFTSGRIRSTGTPGHGDGFAVTYGRIEARIKLPVGYGLWPAFWMLPTGSPYGGWPVGGEIDIMEAMGRQPGISTSAIHFGRNWPENTHVHGSYQFPAGHDITDFNVYAVEWEPGEMRFFVNEHNFWTVNNWWAQQPNTAAPLMFPAPFDTPFHMILNLAIGGWFDPVGTAGLDPSIFPVHKYVDYVRVYELIGRPLRELPPLRDTLPTAARQPDDSGNFISNTNFSNITTIRGTQITPHDVWQVTSHEAASIQTPQVYQRDGIDFLHIPITSGGSADWHVQILHSLPLVRGYNYRISFYGFAQAPRSMNIRANAGGRGGSWAVHTAYPGFAVPFTTEKQRFNFYFTMTNTTDINARIEFNLGASGGHDVWLGDIRVEKVEAIDTVKAPIQGNFIWNGTFDQGLGGLAFWSVIRQNGADAVTGLTEDGRNPFNRQFEITNITNTANPEDIILRQAYFRLTNGNFRLILDAQAVAARDIVVRLLDTHTGDIYHEGTIAITQAQTNHQHDFTLSGLPFAGADIEIQFLLGGSDAGLSMDNIRMTRR